ncbi:hypothetical protein Tco_1555068 [Tanacetum coccineum]
MRKQQVLDGFQQERHSPLAQQRYSLKYRPRSSMFKRRLITADQASVFMAMMSDHNSSDLAPQRQEMSVENVSLGSSSKDKRRQI